MFTLHKVGELSSPLCNLLGHQGASHMVSADGERGRQFSYQAFLCCPSSLRNRSLPFLPENLRLHHWLPTPHSGLTAICYSAYTGYPTVCVFVCKMSNLLLVAWLLCEVGRKGGSPRGPAGQWKQRATPWCLACAFPPLLDLASTFVTWSHSRFSMCGICSNREINPEGRVLMRPGRSGQMQCPSGQLLSLERLVFFFVRWGPGCGEERWQKFVLAHTPGVKHTGSLFKW